MRCTGTLYRDGIFTINGGISLIHSTTSTKENFKCSKRLVNYLTTVQFVSLLPAMSNSYLSIVNSTWNKVMWTRDNFSLPFGKTFVLEKVIRTFAIFGHIFDGLCPCTHVDTTHSISRFNWNKIKENKPNQIKWTRET